MSPSSWERVFVAFLSTLASVGGEGIVCTTAGAEFCTRTAAGSCGVCSTADGLGAACGTETALDPERAFTELAVASGRPVRIRTQARNAKTDNPQATCSGRKFHFTLRATPRRTFSIGTGI